MRARRPQSEPCRPPPWAAGPRRGRAWAPAGLLWALACPGSTPVLSVTVHPAEILRSPQGHQALSMQRVLTEPSSEGARGPSLPTPCRPRAERSEAARPGTQTGRRLGPRSPDRLGISPAPSARSCPPGAHGECAKRVLRPPCTDSRAGGRVRQTAGCPRPTAPPDSPGPMPPGRKRS